MQIISDFDFTLSKFSFDGIRGYSSYAVIEKSGLLSEKYHEGANALQNFYYPIEVSTVIDHITKEEHMLNWHNKAHELLLEHKLKKSHIALAVDMAMASNKIGLREGTDILFGLTEKNQIPLLIFSAGLANIITEVISKQIGRTHDNIHIASNVMRFNDETNDLIGFEDPKFHVYNKKASSILNSPFFMAENMDERDNVILLGDSLGDLKMSDGVNFNAHSIIKIGFLNDRIDRLPEYIEQFDIVIIGDPHLNIVNDLIVDICSE